MSLLSGAFGSEQNKFEKNILKTRRNTTMKLRKFRETSPEKTQQPIVTE